MAIGTAILQPANQGKGPLPFGSLGNEDWELTGDGAATSVVITVRRLRSVRYAVGTEATVTVSGKTATLIFAAAIANGAKKVIRLFGIGR